MNREYIYDSSKNKLSVEKLYEVGGYNTYCIYVKSNKFEGECNFCVSANNIKKIVDQLGKMNRELYGELCFKDCESDAYINILFKGLNKLIVKGQIGGSYEKHFLKFEFEADQTILKELKDAVK